MIYLSGGGNEKESFVLDQAFLKAVPIGSRVLYLPTALENSRYGSAESWFKNLLALHKREDLIVEVVHNLAGYTSEKLAVFHAIYVGGGNTWKLISEVETSGFDKALIDYLKNGGSVYGGSAGAIILGKRIDTHGDLNEIQWGKNLGLDLLAGYSVACHFKEEDSLDCRKWTISENHPLICLPEPTGLIFNGDILQCVGEELSSVFYPNGTRTEIKPGESFSLT